MRLPLLQVRQFQIKFSQERDYYTALAILGEINCPLTEGTTPPVHPLQRMPSSSSWTSAPSVQLTTTTATNVNSMRTPDSNAMPFYPMPGAMSDMMTSTRSSVPSCFTTRFLTPRSLSSPFIIVKHYPSPRIARRPNRISPAECYPELGAHKSSSSNGGSHIPLREHGIPENRHPPSTSYSLP